MKHMKKNIYLAIMVLAVIAWFNALYLSYHAIIASATPSDFYSLGNQLFCDFNSTFSCSEVFKSADSKIFWLPFPTIAVLVYPVLFCLALLWYVTSNTQFARALTVLALGWMMFNGYFISIEYFKIGAFCPLCLVCSAIIITIFISSICIWICGETTNKRK